MDSNEPLKKLINKRQYKDAEELAKKSNKFDELIDMLTNNRHAKQATLILKKNKLPLEKYPKLVERLRKRYVRYVMDTVSPEQAELRFLSNKHCLAVLAEDLCYKSKINESLSLVKRHELQPYIAKTELLEMIGSDFEYIDNAYLAVDGFGELSSANGQVERRDGLRAAERVRHRPRARRVREHAGGAEGACARDSGQGVCSCGLTRSRWTRSSCPATSLARRRLLICCSSPRARTYT